MDTRRVRTQGVPKEVATPLVRAPRPRADLLTGPYWRLGSTGQLHMLRCDQCGFVSHPPAPICRRCRSREVGWQPLLGTGRLFGHGVNAIDWGRGLPSFSVGIVELDDQPGLRVFSRIVDCAPEDLRVGMPVQVRFERLADHPADGDDGPIFLPVFAPQEDAA